MKENLLIFSLLVFLMGCTSIQNENTTPISKIKTTTTTTKIIVDNKIIEENNEITITAREENAQPETIAENKGEKKTSKIELDGINQVNIAEKTIKNKLVYNKKDMSKPFTGKFLLVIGVHEHYVEEYKDGKLDGEKLWFAEDGTLGMKEVYKNGKKNGVQETYYDETGGIRSRINYKNDKVFDFIEWYKEDGTLREKINLNNGTGKWKVYWNNGNIKEEGNLINGIPNGEWKKYSTDGKLEKKTVYKNGALISQEWIQ